MPLNCGAGEDSWEFLSLQGDQFSQSQRKSILNIHWKHWCWSWSSSTLATWCREQTHWKRPWCWERLREEEKGVTEGEMVGRHNWLNGHKFEQTPGDSEGQGSLPCCSPWDHRVRHDLVTEQQNWQFKELVGYIKVRQYNYLSSDTAATKCHIKFTNPPPSISI